MDVNVILDVLQTIGYLALGGLTLYFKYNTKLNQRVTKYIDLAEEQFKDVTKSGGLKYEWVVEHLYKLVPYPFNMFFTREMIGDIVQTTFNEMTNYTTKQLDKIVDKVID